jgi:hypothetical protein
MTQQLGNDIVEQAVAYCRHQASKGIDSLVALMERTQADWERCLEGITQEQADFAPGSEWSARQVVNHFLDVTDGVNHQIARVTAGGELGATDEELVAEEGKFSEAKTVAEMRAGVATIFDRIKELTRGLEGNPHLEKTFPHPLFGQLNILEWIAFQRMHGMDHMQQIDKNKADAGYPAA